MSLKRLGPSDIHISPIGLGTWAVGGDGEFGWGPQDDADSVAAIQRSIERGINWIDTAPLMVQTLLVESFENSNRIVSVGRQSVTLRADYSLLTELREFQAEYNGAGAPKVRVRINAKLVKMPQRIIIGTTTVERVQAAASGDMKSVVHAFDTALGKTLKRIVEWTLVTPPPRKKR